jgi:nucleotide-binding universal stress UspA family protein/CBS domain-containing protein
MRIKTLMSSPAAAIGEDAGLDQARGLMDRGRTDDLPVTNGARLVGVLRRRNLHRLAPSTIPRLARYELPCFLEDIPVREVMARNVPAVAPDTGVEEAACLARARQAQSLPVLEDDALVGMVTRADLLNALIELLEHDAPTSFGHILVPTDFGRAAGRALEAAMDLAARHRARLTLLHVLSPGMRAAVPEGIPSPFRAEIREDRRQRCLARLRSLAFREGEIGAVTCQVAMGDPTDEIVRVAARTEADLIVMGTRGGGRLRRLIGGGVTAAVARIAPCPVLAVKA